MRCRAEQTLSLPRRERLWQAYLVFGFIAAAHVLLVLFTHWSVNVKCAVAFRACGNVQRATHCKVGALGAAAALPPCRCSLPGTHGDVRRGAAATHRKAGCKVAPRRRCRPATCLRSLAWLGQHQGQGAPRRARRGRSCGALAAPPCSRCAPGAVARLHRGARRGAARHRRPHGELFSSWRAKPGYRSRGPIFLPRPRICCCRAAVSGARRRGR